MIKFDRENKGWINEEIAKGKTLTEANKNKADDKLVKAGIMKPAKGITPVIDAVTAEKQKEEIDKHVADELADKKKISLTVKAPDPKAPAPKCESFSIDVKDRNDLGKLIEGLKKDGSKFIITKSAKEGYRYAVKTTKSLNESEDNGLKYFEICIADDKGNKVPENEHEDSIVIRGYRKPSKEEASEFIKDDREKLFGGRDVSDVHEVSPSEAEQYFDVSDIKSKPIFGSKNECKVTEDKHEEGKKNEDKPDPLTITLDTLAKVKDIIAKGDDEDDDAGCVEHCIELVKQNLGKKEDDDKELKAEDEPKLSDDDLDDDDNMGITLSGDGVKDFVPDADDDDISGLGFLGDK